MIDEVPKRSEDSVLLLYANTDYRRIDELVLAVRPNISVRCHPGRRLILENDLQQTYLVERADAPAGSAWPRVSIRPARPILDAEYVARLFEGVT